MGDKKIKLERINLNGYKSYGAADSNPITLNDINIIIGANGAGKSNFISFMELIAYIASSGLDYFVAKNGFSSSLLHFGEFGKAKIHGDLFFSLDDAIDGYSFTLAETIGGKLYFENEEVYYEKKGKKVPYRKELGVSVGNSNLIEYAKNNETIRVILNLLKGCRIFHFNDTSINSAMRSRSYLYDNAYLRADAGNIASFLYRLKNEYEDYYYRIINVIREVFSRFDDFDFNPTSMSDADSYVILNWKETGTEAVFGPHLLSDGTIRFIALATLLLQPEELLPKVLILDEPEMGLHPYAIQVLADLMNQISNTSQIIVATQSIELLNKFDPENVIVVDYDKQKKSSTLRRLDEGQLENWLADYSLGDLWNKNILGGMP